MNKTNKTSTELKTPKVTLSDTAKKARKDSTKAKRAVLVGKNFDDLKASEKDVLLKSLLEMFALIDASGIVL